MITFKKMENGNWDVTGLRWGDRLIHTVKGKVRILLNEYIVAKYGTFGDEAYVSLFCISLFGGMKSKKVPHNGDITKTFSLSHFYPEGINEGWAVVTKDGEEHWAPPTDPYIEDGCLVVGNLAGHKKMEGFRVHYPNRIQRLHDNQWVTLSGGGEPVFDEITTDKQLTDLINFRSSRFRYYDFYVVK